MHTFHIYCSGGEHIILGERCHIYCSGENIIVEKVCHIFFVLVVKILLWENCVLILHICKAPREDISMGEVCPYLAHIYKVPIRRRTHILPV